MSDKDLEGLAGCFAALVYMAVSLGLYAVAAWCARYAAAELFQKQLPFWPLFAGLWALGFLLKKVSRGSTLVKP